MRYGKDGWVRNTGFRKSRGNEYLERAVLTGITRISKESAFSDLNNLAVVTTTSKKYARAFGFTEEEVFAALEEQGLSDRKQSVKKWYDGFVIGGIKDIYNPWSIINFLNEKKIRAYWANSSSNALVSNLISRGDERIKDTVAVLMRGGSFKVRIDEQIVFSQLEYDDHAVWSLLLACGYLKVLDVIDDVEETMLDQPVYELALTNMETRAVFRKMIGSWFRPTTTYNDFIKAMLDDDTARMNAYMERVFKNTVSFYDAGKVDPETS